MRQAPSAMTFVEILVATGILVVCCLVILALLPASLTTQQMTRYRIYAAASAMSLMDAAAHPSTEFPVVDQTRYGFVANTSPPQFNQAPRPGWGAYLRSRMTLGSAFAPDFEQVVSAIGGGAIPVPLEIARRLDSDDNEIARLLDQGSALLYLDPAAFRGMSNLTTATTASALAGMPDEFHHLVCAVVTPAQQNVLPVHPFYGAGPMVQLYPFPPMWHYWDGTGWALTPVDTGPRRQSSVSRAWTSPSIPSGAGALNGDPHSLAGRHYAVLDADTYQYATRWINTGSTALPFDTSQPAGMPHGVTWKYLADLENARGNTGSPWVRGWWAFKRLGADEFAGWLPVSFMLDRSGTPPTYEQLANYRDRAMFLWMQVMPPSLRASFPVPKIYAQDDVHATELANRFSAEGFGGPYESFTSTTLDGHGRRHLVKYGDPADAAGFRNQNVRDHGLEYYPNSIDGTFWSWSTDTHASSPFRHAEFRWVEPKDYDPAQPYADANGKSALEQFPFADPRALPAGEFPPHPAQVYALSYLAHAAMLVAGAARPENSTDYFNGYHTRFIVDQFSSKVTDADRVFARKVHEMCLRWAVCYADERPADWGAPRPENRPVMNDRLLTMFDLWFDGAARSTSGPAFTPTPPALPGTIEDPAAIRVPQNLGGDPATAAAWDRDAPFESFYRWIEPPNPNLPRFAGGLRHVRSNVGPVGYGHQPSAGSAAALSSLGVWRQRNEHAQAASASTVGFPWPAWLSEPYAGNDTHADPARRRGDDARRHWIDRPFAAQHRARELVYWAVDWKSYEDAEEAPSYPVDMARAGRFVRSGGTLEILNWLGQAPSAGMNVEGFKVFGGSEIGYAWTAADRALTRFQQMAATADAVTPAHSPVEVQHGAFGADRNMNGIFDRGTVPRNVRMRARQVARFVLYDPILRLHQGGL